MNNNFFIPLSDLEIGRRKREKEIMDDLSINCYDENYKDLI